MCCLTASLARCQGGRTASRPEEHQGRLGRQARVPARRGGHDFYSMSSEMAGKDVFPLRLSPPSGNRALFACTSPCP